MTVIKVCLGTSCYVRGNEDTLSFLEDYIKKNKKDAFKKVKAYGEKGQSLEERKKA